MAELYPTDANLNALSGAADGEQEVLFITTGESPYYTSFYKMLLRLLQVARRAGDLRIYQDGDLTFGVRPGKFFNGATAVDYAGATGQALTNNQTNYVYLTAAGVLTVNTTGFPSPALTPHVRLGTIVTAAGTYDGRDAADGGDVDHRHRARAMYQVSDGVSAADKQDLLPNLGITAGAEAADKRTITIQAKDAGANNLAQRFLARLWIATADFSTPSAAGNTYALVTGTAHTTNLANADYTVISDANGVVAFDLTIAGAATRYIMAEVDGRIYSSGAITWAA